MAASDTPSCLVYLTRRGEQQDMPWSFAQAI